MFAIFEKIFNFLKPVNAEYIVYGAFGLLALIALIGLIVVLSTSYCLRYRAAISKALKANKKNWSIEPALLKLPKLARLKYEQFLESGLSAEKVLTADALVDTPAKRSWMYVFTRTMFYATLSVTLLLLFVLFALSAGDFSQEIAFTPKPLISASITLIFGLLLTLIFAIAGKAAYNATLSRHHSFTRLVNTTAVRPHIPAAAGVSTERDSGISFVDFRENREEPVPYVTPAPVVPAVAPAPVVTEAPVLAEEESAATAEPETPPAPKPRAPRKKPAPKPAAASSADGEQVVVTLSSTDEVLRQVDEAYARGASQKVLKELSVKIKLERARPENKNPQMQARLDEAVKKLLSIMANN